MNISRDDFSDSWAFVKMILYKQERINLLDLVLYGVATTKVRLILNKNPKYLKEDKEEYVKLQKWCRTDHPNFCKQIERAT